MGRIEKVEDVEKSDNLVRLIVNFGEFKRTILVGMKKERENPKEIEGKQALFVVNLEPKKMMGEISEGMAVLDLGSGAGFDCFLAARKVGPAGKVIGIDMTKEMIERAKLNAEKLGTKNVEFILSDIEKMPISDSSIDIIITNCVVNLTPDKSETFREAHRVLKAGGRIYLSDIVLLAELSKEQRNDNDLLSGCVAGALLKDDYLAKLKSAGFEINILKEDKEISKKQYQGIALESLMLEAVKRR